jgi:hypothetical protein
MEKKLFKMGILNLYAMGILNLYAERMQIKKQTGHDKRPATPTIFLNA